MVREHAVQLTTAGKARLEEELQTLRTAKLPGLAARIHEASTYGDISDNSEYEAMKEEYVLTEARIGELEQILLHAETIRRAAGDDSVGLGSVVTLRDDAGEEETWTLVNPAEAATHDGTISTESPVGRALIGCHAGDAPTVTTPVGTIVYTVVRVA